MKKRKLKTENIIIALVFIISSIVVLHDLYILFIQPIFTTYLTTFTWFGLITFIIALFVMVETFDYLYTEIKKDL